MNLHDIIETEVRHWMAPENRIEAAFCAGAFVLIAVIFGTGALMRWVSLDNISGGDVSPAWSEYVADRVAAGDIGCDDGPYYMRIGKFSSVWMNYPIAYGASPEFGGLPDEKTGKALYRAFKECLEGRLEGVINASERNGRGT